MIFEVHFPNFPRFFCQNFRPKISQKSSKNLPKKSSKNLSKNTPVTDPSLIMIRLTKSDPEMSLLSQNPSLR